MFIVPTYGVAVALCFVTMLCWGSWGNTQKLAAKSWRYELFYWDYVIGMVLFALLLAFTLGSIGSEGRSFLPDLAQASASSILWILVGGIIFNASNILLSASISLAGMSVAFPLGVGIALVMGVVNNYRVAVAQGAKTGNVTGNPTKGGYFTVAATATYADKTKVDATFLLTVTPVPTVEPKRTKYCPLTTISSDPEMGTATGTGVYAEGKKASIDPYGGRSV